jgi:hypothetical protein
MASGRFRPATASASPGCARPASHQLPFPEDTCASAEAGPPVVQILDTCGNVAQPVLTCPRCDGERPGAGFGRSARGRAEGLTGKSGTSAGRAAAPAEPARGARR